MKRIKNLGYSLLIVFSVPLFAVGPHLERPSGEISLTKKYHLIDLGEPNADAAYLSMFGGNSHSSPKINNAGDISANGLNGGFFIRNDFTVFEPSIADAKIIIQDMNDRGDLLVEIDRGNLGIEWNVWLKDKGWCQGPLTVGTREVPAGKVFLSGINDCLTVVGETHPDGKYRAVIWSPERGMRRYTTPKEPDLSAQLLHINNRGTILGRPMNSIEKPPFIISAFSGVIVPDKYRAKINPNPDGRIEFPNFVLNEDDTVYGNFWVNEKFADQAPATTVYHAFKWVPGENVFRYLDLNGMRIAGVNGRHCLVGAWNGKAAFCEPEKRPIELSAAVLVDSLAGWELLEATSINNAGQIVGFGKKDGNIHLFLADPLSR